MSHAVHGDAHKGDICVGMWLLCSNHHPPAGPASQGHIPVGCSPVDGVDVLAFFLVLGDL